MTHSVFTVVWSGAAGLPGYSKFRFTGELDPAAAAPAMGRVKTFFQGIATLIPAQVTLNFLSTYQVIDTNGTTLFERSIPSVNPVVGSGAGVFAAPAGACINWTTGAYHNGRKVRGRTFIVPLAGVAYQTDGTLADAARVQLNDGANSLRGGTPPLCVHSDYGDLAGGDTDITGSSVSDRVSILKSRRG